MGGERETKNERERERKGEREIGKAGKGYTSQRMRVKARRELFLGSKVRKGIGVKKRGTTKTTTTIRRRLEKG